MRPLSIDAAAVLRELREAMQTRATTGDNRPFNKIIMDIKAVAPQVICPGCSGHPLQQGVGRCSLCNGRGLVCPNCKGALWMRSPTGGKTDLVRCTTCASVELHDGLPVSVPAPIKLAHAIQKAYRDGLEECARALEEQAE